jgi:hypothetical protein
VGSTKSQEQPGKHGIAFDEATTVFDDTAATIFSDEDHSNGEEREIIVGHSVLDRLLLVSFAENSTGIVRIISARKATRRERKDMKKTSRSKASGSKDMHTEYRFDYSKARPNRFARDARGKAVVVLLAPDVARVFKTGESVNDALRALMKAIPRRKATSSSH